MISKLLSHAREPAYPLLVSLLLYLVDETWDRDWHGETLFLDTQTEIGLTVQPKMYRAVLMDQDIMHRIVQPSARANRARYSLVWKLALLPKTPEQVQHFAHLACLQSSSRFSALGEWQCHGV